MVFKLQFTYQLCVCPQLVTPFYPVLKPALFFTFILSFIAKAIYTAQKIQIKLKFYWSVIRPIVVYGCETRVVKESIIQKLSVLERKIFGPTKEDNGIWRIKTKKKLD
jgi:hypothetical protein